MYTLFIDTHDKEILLGLFKDDSLIGKKSFVSKKGHSEYIMPLLKDMLDDSNIKVNDLNEILVVNGPGSFTGVRLGVIIAKTLAFTLDKPIKTLTSLECIAISNDSNKKLPIIRDLKGVFGAFFEGNTIKEDYFYRSNDEFDEYIKNNNYEEYIIDNGYIDLDKVYEYAKTKETTIHHAVNPIYIKVIEVLKDDKESK